MVLYNVSRKGLLPCFLERKHVLAERSDQDEGSREEQTLAVRPDSRGSAASISWYWVREELLAGSPSSCETALENEKPDLGGW